MKENLIKRDILVETEFLVERDWRKKNMSGELCKSKTSVIHQMGDMKNLKLNVSKL